MRAIQLGAGIVYLPEEGEVNNERYVAPEAPDLRITKRSFYDRLTPEEEIAIDLAGFGDTEQAASVRRFIRRLEQSPFVDLAFQQTIDALHWLESIGLIGVGRASQILNAPVTETEKYRG